MISIGNFTFDPLTWGVFIIGFAIWVTWAYNSLHEFKEILKKKYNHHNGKS